MTNKIKIQLVSNTILLNLDRCFNEKTRGMQVRLKSVSKSNSEFAKIFTLDGHSVRKTDYCCQPRAQ
jgi:hypothetical protein